ncbi:MAG: DUF1552 domain-containing protein [Deltaproteobacteria bacterium]|nr:DUF1552 domain-containing protein [Deltaproteobacteria bacterium]
MSLSRRALLRGLAGLAAVPALRGLARLVAPDGRAGLDGAARAAAPPGTKRLVVFYTGQGHLRDQFLSPAGGLGPALEPLAPFADRLLVLHNVKGSSGHYEGHAESLTGRPNGETFTAAGGPSLDQRIAELHRGKTALPSLELGCHAGNGADGMIAYAASGLPIPAAQDPRGVFDRMFRLVNEDPAAAARRRAQDKSVLDVVKADLADASAGLSAEARRLLDAHATLVREQEQALASPVEVAACELGAAPVAGPEGRWDYPTACRLQIENAALALGCDVTRVVTFMLGYAQNTTVHDWLGHSEDFHQIAHGSVADSEAKMLAIDRWQAAQLATLLGRLDALGLYDDTAVVWLSELGLHRFDHLKSDSGMVIAGTAGGALRTGRVVDMGQAHHHDVLLTLGRALGLDLERFGDEGTRALDALLA